MKKLSCAQARQIDLVDYLKSLGFQPKKIRGQDYWFCSPFRDERTASFKINKSRNIWFDFGEGKGGNFVDFGVRFYNCSISELLQKLSQKQTFNFSFPPPSLAGEKKDVTSGKVLILDERRLSSKSLFEYLKKRCIPLEIAEHFCRQIDFLLYGKKYTAIGFQNNAGGYELRSENFKGSSSPKDITFIDYDKEKVAVFEGFFSFLSFQAINRNKIKVLTILPEQQANILVLNSLSFFEKSREKMESHQKIHLFLDRDKAGLKRTELALQWSDKYIDRSIAYKEFKDLNEYLIKSQTHQLKQSHRLGRHF
jgi:hypothetical protein